MKYRFEAIKEFREAIGYTQSFAADRAGIAYQQWQRWESGESIPSCENLCKIFDALYLPIDSMIFFFK